MIKGKRIFVTGGAGFIGSHLITKLYKDNKIMIFDNLARNAIKETDLLLHQNVSFVQGDVLDAEAVKKSIDSFRPQIVINFAAVAGIFTVGKKPVHTLKVNMIGTMNVLDACMDHLGNIERFLDCSTCEVFGTHAYNVDETANTSIPAVGEPRWTYALGKLAGEFLSHSYYQQYGLPTVSVRPFNIYGPRQVGEGAVNLFITNVIKGDAIEVHGDGAQVRSWCYVEDFVEGVLLCLEKEEAIGHSFNIGNPEGTITIATLAEKVKEISEKDAEINFIPKDYADCEIRLPNISKAKELLGYAPKVTLEEGLRATYKWFEEKIEREEKELLV